MNQIRATLAAALLAVVSSFIFQHSAFGQGALTPPGAPAPMFKTLAQVQPRVDVQTLPSDGSAQFVISAPGAYYLTGNLTGAVAKAVIAIATNNVSLDLNGFALIGVSGATRGIDLRGGREVVIENGSLRGFDSGGITASGGTKDLRIEKIQLSGISNGSGISFPAGNSSGVIIRGCTISGVTNGFGISGFNAHATVGNCTVSECSGVSVIGIAADTVTGCAVVNLTGTSTSAITEGIDALVVQNCTVSSIVNTNTGPVNGIQAPVVKGCNVSTVSASANAASGIVGATVEGCSVATVNGLSSTGISTISGVSQASVANCRVGSIGTTSNTSCFGISASAGSVVNCAVGSVGNSAATSSCIGITGSLVADSSVNGVTGGTAGNVFGISSFEVSRCVVNGVNLASGTGSSIGVSADVISDVRLSNLGSGGSNDVVGLLNYRLARNCSITSMSSSGAGQIIGCRTQNPGRTENIAIAASVDVGISVLGGHTVTGCTTGIATTGIFANGSRNVIDGNNVTGSSTTGIMVRDGFNSATALVIRNQVRLCTTNFTLDGGCQVGPFISATNTIATTSPWANFTD